MKIKSFRLLAYGPFTDVTIDLPNTGTDFHMLFGPNEAGKSSALRALRHLLFGIPARTADNFLHGYPKLRIGARLVSRNGDEIEFTRRKGQAKTLRGRDDETVLDKDTLAPFLGGVSADVFEQMFAIGHDDLVEGGQEIVSGKGNVGEALFAAGAGLIRLQNVQKELEQACGSLFKPSGSTPLINKAIKAIKTARQEQKDALLLPKTWKEQDLELRDAQKRLGDIKQALAAKKQRQAKLERMKESLPLIARKREIDTDLADYQGVPDLADDFGEKRVTAEKDMQAAARDLERSQATLEKLKKKIDALPIHEALLENAASIESLQHELGSFRKAQKDRPGLEARMWTLQKQARETLDEIGNDITGEAAEGLNLSPSTVDEIKALGKNYERLSAKQESVQEAQRKRETRLTQLAGQRKSMPVPAELSHLEIALQTAQEAGPIERQLDELHASCEMLDGELNRSLKRQILWKGTLAQVDELRLPSKETIDRFEARFDARQRAIEKHQAAKATAEDDITQTLANIEAIDRSQEVPTETDLHEARALRDRGWELIRQKLDGHPPSTEASQQIMGHFDTVSNLPDAFEASMYRVDQVSDRLRREADQVSKKGLLEAQKERQEKALADAKAALEAAMAQQAEVESEWRYAWEPAGITPQTPREMRGWHAEITRLREKLSDLRSKKRQIKTLGAQLAALKKDLLVAIEAAGYPQDQSQPLSVLIKTAQAYIKTQNTLRSDIASADRELAHLKADLAEGASAIAELDQALSKWKAGWENSVGKIGIRADATPTAALAVIESVKEVGRKISEADILGKRIKGIDRDADEFKSRVEELVEILAPDLKKESQDRAAELLNGRLNTARKDETRHLNLTELLKSAQKEQDDAQRRLDQCQTLIDSLCKEANCQNAESLAETEKRARECKALTRELTDLEKRLRELGAGATVEAFIAEAAAMDADTIEPELQELDTAAEALEKERSELDQKIGALKDRLNQMDGRSQAAIHAEGAERLLAGLESTVEQYARMKIASVILSRTVEQYREKHQGPLISRASDLFSKMTLGSFSRLRADYDDKGNPVLVGIRSENEAQVHVEGMSDGSADQLYLALRLASLEQYLENNEPLPFVVDDILLRFDDDRALATLSVLAKLAEKTQVLFFTHHQHLIDLAGSSVDQGLNFQLHSFAAM
jgi:uncharacterized protein YhaN